MRLRTVCSVTAVFLCFATRVGAQGPPPRIGPLVIDLRGTLPGFPNSPGLAESRGIATSELPGRGIGIDAAAHVFPLKVRMVTVGLGGEIMLARAHSAPAAPDLAVTSRFTTVAAQLSLNFGTGDGWSYLSGGIGSSRWSIVPDGATPQIPDENWLRTFDYGGGARWFAKPHLAFHVDVRLHAINPGPAQLLLPGTPLVRLLIIGAGVSIK